MPSSRRYPSCCHDQYHSCCRHDNHQRLTSKWQSSQAPRKALWHLDWLAGGHHARPRATLAWIAGTKQGPVARIACLGLARGWAPCKAPCHLVLARGRASCKAPWYTSHVLARLAGTMQGPVARVMVRAVARVMCLSLVKIPSFHAFAKFLRDDMTWARGWDPDQQRHRRVGGT